MTGTAAPPAGPAGAAAVAANALRGGGGAGGLPLPPPPGPRPLRRHAAAWDGRSEGSGGILITRPGMAAGLQNSGFSAYEMILAGSRVKDGKAESRRDDMDAWQ